MIIETKHTETNNKGGCGCLMVVLLCIAGVKLPWWAIIIMIIFI